LSLIAHVSYGCAYGCEPRHPTSSQHRAVSRIRESEDGPRVFSQSNPSPISQNLNPPKVLTLAFKPSISPELSAFKAPVPPHMTPFQSLNNPNDVRIDVGIDAGIDVQINVRIDVRIDAGFDGRIDV